MAACLPLHRHRLQSCHAQVVDASRDRAEPVTLELGLGDVLGNPLAKALEQAARGHHVGDVVTLEITGGPHRPELVFRVPHEHEEIVRLQGRYGKCALERSIGPRPARLGVSASRRLSSAIVLVSVSRCARWRTLCASIFATAADIRTCPTAADARAGCVRRQGGLQAGMLVELRNGGLARVLEMADADVVLDANNMLAGTERHLEVEVLAVEPGTK